VEYQIKSASHAGKEFVEVTLTGDTTSEMVIALFADLNARAEGTRLLILIDEMNLRPALIGPRDLKKIASFWRTTTALRAARMAVIAPNPVMYGLNRMFALIANDESIHVFMWRQDAIAWLFASS
jgi:hypothetical protein